MVGGWTRKSSCHLSGLSHLYHRLLAHSTHALDALAKSLPKKNVAIPMEDRAAFAKAVKEAMDALAKQS